MKKMYWISLSYIVFGLISGVLSREITYRTHFTGETSLSLVHPHAILLGGLVFLLLPLFMKAFAVEKQKSFKLFLWVYNIGLSMTLIFLAARGMSQLLTMPFPQFWDHMVGGLAGIGHIVLTVGLGFLFHALIRSAGSDRS